LRARGKQQTNKRARALGPEPLHRVT
jgi:hypothetical protein